MISLVLFYLTISPGNAAKAWINICDIQIVTVDPACVRHCTPVVYLRDRETPLQVASSTTAFWDTLNFHGRMGACKR